MTTTINASSTNGLVQTADGSGILKVQSNGVTTNALAWVNFNGTSGAVRASYNVGSVTRNGTGDYTLNFTTTLSDANYSVSISGDSNSASAEARVFTTYTVGTTSSQRLTCYNTAAAGRQDPTYMYVSIFGN